jgi:hypothetical protein
VRFGGMRLPKARQLTRRRSVGLWSHWNNAIINQAIRTLWTAHSDEKTLDGQRRATVSALVGMGPKDEIEGMLAAQFLAAHNASMECYRRGMLGEQTFEGRRENLNQANKLSRTYATLLKALNRHRGKGAQKVTVEHVHMHAGGQAVVGVVQTRGDRAKSEDQAMQSRLPMHLSKRCGARTRSGSACQSLSDTIRERDHRDQHQGLMRTEASQEA